MIDTMTDQPFKGNPTPVFILDEYHQNQYFVEWPRDDVLQKVANEMNQSETIFILGNGDNDATEYLIRSFTPSKEEPFCGHGIVAAAHLLYRSVSQCSGWIMRFVTVGGITVDAQLERTDPDKGFEFGEARIIKLEIPAEPVKEWLDKDGVLRERIARSLGISASDILALGRNALMDLVIEVSDEVDMSAANMHIDAVDLMNASPAGTRSQIITSRGDACGVDFAKRVFAYGSEGKMSHVLVYLTLPRQTDSGTRSRDRLDILCPDTILGSEVGQIFHDREASLGADGRCSRTEHCD